jgi:hypothetical protein
LPLDLRTPDGVELARGDFEVEVRKENGRFVLTFLRKDSPKAVVAGQAPLETKDDLPTVPLVGTTHLRSTAEPIGTAEERHFSKTGRPQYAEEIRDWKTTLRLYRFEDSGRSEVQFVFAGQAPDGQWDVQTFQLLLANK